jgi:prepilin-type N-terminal cleavage/methylation domain-containing protein
MPVGLFHSVHYFSTNKNMGLLIMNTQTYSARKQAGFTLVELAIVMIIIGLLIGGILKGQELIANAQVSATVAQLKGVDAATSTFRDSYGAVAGDMINATVRLANCAAAPCINGNGNGTIDSTPNLAAQAGEALGYWAHLNAAGLVSGVKNSIVVTFGEALPSSPIGGGLTIGYSGVGAIAGMTPAIAPRGGHYVTLRAAPTAAASAASAVMSATEAARIDRKMDDASPNGGTVIAIGGVSAAAGSCVDVATAVGVYNEAFDGQSCSIAVRIQQ